MISYEALVCRVDGCERLGRRVYQGVRGPLCRHHHAERYPRTTPHRVCEADGCENLGRAAGRGVRRRRFCDKHQRRAS